MYLKDFGLFWVCYLKDRHFCLRIKKVWYFEIFFLNIRTNVLCIETFCLISIQKFFTVFELFKWVFDRGRHCDSLTGTFNKDIKSVDCWNYYPEVIRRITHFKLFLLNWNLYQFLESLSKSKKYWPYRFFFSKILFIFSIFQCHKSRLRNKLSELRFIHVLYHIWMCGVTWNAFLKFTSGREIWCGQI